MLTEMNTNAHRDLLCKNVSLVIAKIGSNDLHDTVYYFE